MLKSMSFQNDGTFYNDYINAEEVVVIMVQYARQLMFTREKK